MIRFIKTAGFLVILILIGITWLRVSVENFMTAPMAIPASGMSLEISPGTSFAGVSRTLRERGAIEDDRWFKLYARYTGAAENIHAGSYQLAAGTTPLQALQQFVAGDVQLVDVTLIEGWNYREMLAALHAHESITPTLTDADWPDVLQSLGAESEHPEGLFLPETYRVPQGSTDVDVLRQAYALMQDVLTEEWNTRGQQSAVATPYEALILASIIEKETGRADERQRISGVFTRRLQQNMRLQTDPTVIYGIGPSFNGDITRKDLRTDTPYNTYTRHGLPPTPIAMPGRAAIHAALHPAAGTEIFFVATGLGDGSHTFSDTREEHEAAVDEYLRRYRRNQQGD